MTSDKLTETMQRDFHSNRRKIYKRIMKPVRWNGQDFESGRALLRHLKLEMHTSIAQYIKGGKPLKGHVPEYIKAVVV